MAIHVPAMVVVGALKAIQNQSNNQQNMALSAEQTKRDLIALKRFEMEVSAADARHAREVDALDRHRDRQLVAFQRLADLSQQNAEAKIEAYLSVFRDVREVLRDQQKTYSEELQQVTQASFTADAEGYVLINKRKSEIDKELAAIRTAITENAAAAYAKIEAVFPEIPAEHRPALEDLRDV